MPNYKKVQPVIQSGWYTCWAAAMSWWTYAMQDRGRKVLGEQDMMDEFPYSWDKNGAMTIQGMSTIFNTQKFLMNCRFSGAGDLDRIIGKLSGDPVKAFDAFPIVVGYNDSSAGGNHIAVICEFDSTDLSYQKLVVMDPAKGYRVRSRDYLASQTMIFAWPKEAGDIIYG
jgi:hypothetical protein